MGGPTLTPRERELALAGEVAITCSCGATHPVDHFCEAPMAGKLPHNHYQCPTCRRAWTIRHGKIVITKTGFVLSEPNKIEPIHSYL